MPEALQERLLTAMQQASQEEAECREMEQLLRRLKPAGMPARLVGLLGVQMFVESQQQRHGGRRRAYWRRGGAAAAAVLLFGVVGATLLVPRHAVAESAPQGLVSRNVIETQKTSRVEWRHGEAPVRHYEVVYEDSFVLEDDEDTTLIIQVPNRTEVEIEEDYL